jgi:hypothetical protein
MAKTASDRVLTVPIAPGMDVAVSFPVNIKTTGRWVWLIAIPLAYPAAAQVVSHGERLDLTLEGYANLAAGFATSSNSSNEGSDDKLRVDGALRGLARWKNSAGPDIGLRVVLESSAQDRLQLAEVSVLVFGRAGRLEIGQRPGLPDVLTGYAPNNFIFTGAEFGPASGPSLDPGGGLQHAFLAPDLALSLNALAYLGATAALADDRSAKLVYVSPKHRGFLAGISYAPNADDLRFDRLIQAGLVHERYWDSNILRLGGSISLAHGDARRVSASAQRSQYSFNAGAALILDNAWMLGISATWNGASGLARSVADPAASQAFGATASVNYNYGRWTAGAYYQWARAEGDPRVVGNDSLRAAEVGLSYRLTTKLRFYGAVYVFDFAAEGGLGRADRYRGTALLLGVRATL